MSHTLICNDRWTYHVWKYSRIDQPVNGRIMYVGGCVVCGLIDTISPGLTWVAWVNKVGQQ